MLSKNKTLRRDLQAQALLRLEQSARDTKDFENIISWWDKLDANRERRERYHEISRSGEQLPLDFGAVKDGLSFPVSSVLDKQIQNGDFIDFIFYCPYQIHELVTSEYISEILKELSVNHKELLFLYAVNGYSTAKIAIIKGQSDRNIRKIRNTIIKKIHKKMLISLKNKKDKHNLTLNEKEFLNRGIK